MLFYISAANKYNFSFYHGIFVLDPDLYLLIRVPDPTFIIQIRIRITAEKERGMMQIFFCWWYQFYATPLLLLLLWAAVVPRPSHPTSWRSCDGPWSSSHYSREVREECSPIPIYIRYHTCCHWRSEKIVTGGDAVSSKGHFTTWSLIFIFFKSYGTNTNNYCGKVTVAGLVRDFGAFKP